MGPAAAPLPKLLHHILHNASEYEERLARPFVPPTVSLKDIRDSVPKHLLRRDPWRSSAYIVRDVILCGALFLYASRIDVLAKTGLYGVLPHTAAWQVGMLKSMLWLNYLWWQGLVFASFFCLAHELGHEALYNSWYANNIAGFILSTFILLPFYSWKATHNAHHKAVGSMERDENYVPHLRNRYQLPSGEKATKADYAEAFEETPFVTLWRMIMMQTFGWWFYLSANAMGSEMYPQGTNHFSPYSPLFNDKQRRGILMSDIGLIAMLSVLRWFAVRCGLSYFMLAYFIPYMLCNHWIVMCTFLHHSDPSIPHYRKGAWTYVRGIIATVDRPLLGWMGRFFLHNVSHDHIAHHFFPGTPFYNQPAITAAVRGVLKGDYNYDSTNSFYALYRSFSECVFVEEEGDIVFYKNARGEAARAVDEAALGAKTEI